MGDRFLSQGCRQDVKNLSRRILNIYGWTEFRCWLWGFGSMEKVYEMVELGAGVGTPSGACLRMWSGPVLVLPTVFVLPWEASDFGESGLAS